MKTNDEALLKIKYDVLRTVSKLAFEGKLEEERDNIPFKLIPGPKAQFRCCVYKEREIIRQRVRLAEGKCPSDKQSNNIIQVISSACEECPITRFVVTDNCQKCMGKACQNACNFGAISIGRDRAHIDPSVCKECGRCAQACPYNAIAELIRPCRRACPVDAITMDTETGICQIDEKKCIQCGACQKVCKMDIRVWKTPNSPECIRCGDCKSVCPTGSIRSTMERMRAEGSGKAEAYEKQLETEQV